METILFLGVLLIVAVCLFGAFVAVTALVTAVVIVLALLFACIARNCRASDAIGLLLNAGPFTAWEYVRSDAPLPPLGREEVALLAEPKPKVTEFCWRVRRRWRSTYVYTLDKGDLWRKKMMKEQMEHLRR